MEMHGRPIVSNFEDDEASFRDRLARVFRFTDADLAENKQGRLTTHQKLTLLWTAITPFAALLVSLAGLIALAIGLYYVGPLITARIRLMLYFGKYLGFAAGTLFFGLIAFLIKLLLASGRIVSLVIDLADNKVSSVMGRLTTSKNEEIEDGLATLTKTKTRTFCYVVKGEYFEVSQDAWDAMHERDGGSYRVYVTPRSRFLVAIESAISDPEARDPFKLQYSTSSH